MPLFLVPVLAVGLFVNLLVLAVITLSSKPAFVRSLNKLLLAVNIALLALVFGLLGVFSMPYWFPGTVPVALALLGGALVASIPMLVGWTSNRVANPEWRRALVWSGAAIVVIGVGTMSLLQIDRPPSYPSLSEQPDSSIPGTVVYLQVTADQGECLYTVPAAGGESRRLTCMAGPFKGIAWVSDGRILVKRGWPAVYSQVDTDTGEEISTVPAADLSKADRRRANAVTDGRWRTERADGAVVERRDYGVVVRSAEGETTIMPLQDDVSSRYSLNNLQWAPDGEWVLVSDSVGRLLIVAADGDPPARILAGEGWGGVAAWRIPGNPTYTVDKADVPK